MPDDGRTGYCATCRDIADNFDPTPAPTPCGHVSDCQSCTCRAAATSTVPSSTLAYGCLRIDIHPKMTCWLVQVTDVVSGRSDTRAVPNDDRDTVLAAALTIVDGWLPGRGAT